jgi:hypothetical protein
MPALEVAVRQLARRDDDVPLDPPGTYASALTLSARSEDLLGQGATTVQRDGVATVATDMAGVVVASLQFGIWEPRREMTILNLDGFRGLILTPLLEAAALILERAEAYGRALLELRIGRLDQIIMFDENGDHRQVPQNLPVGAEITLPLGDASELHAVAELWRSAVGRAAGYVMLRP